VSRARFDTSVQVATPAQGLTTSEAVQRTRSGIVDYKRHLKAWFVLSVAAFGVFYGVAAGQWGWFPKPQLQRAWNQAEAAFTDNPFSFLVPRVYRRHGGEVYKPQAVQPGVTLLSSMWRDGGNWKPQVRVVSRNGEKLHEWQIKEDLFPADSYVHGTHLYPNGHLVVNVEYVGTARLGPGGDVVWRLPRRTHHSVTRAEDGTLWIPSQTGDLTTRYAGLSEAVLPEQILHVSADGDVIESLDLIQILFENGLGRYIFEQHGPRPDGELLHLNDVESLGSSMAKTYPLFQAGDLLVSLRDLHMVFVLDPETRTVRWHAHGPFLRQHDPDFMGKGKIGVFDNRPDGTRRGRVLGGSRIAVLRPSSDTAAADYLTPESDTFYTEAGGKWQQLENGNLLLTEAQAGRVVEIDSTGDVLWEWIHEPTGAEVPQILDGARYPFTPKQVKAWGQQ
jgi:hypothetical protein